MATEDRDWITEGAEVAVATGGIYGHTEYVRIERITATMVILVDGRRYNRATLVERANKYRPSTKIVHPKDPAVVQVFAREQLRTFARAADRLVSGSSATVHTMTAAEVRAAFDALDDQLNALRKEVDRRAGL